VPIVVWDAAVRGHKRRKPAWVDLVWLSGGDLRKRAWESADRRESRSGFSPVAVKQVKVDVGAWGFELGWIKREQGRACVAVGEGEEEDAIQNSTSCDDDETASQESIDPVAWVGWSGHERMSMPVSAGQERKRPYPVPVPVPSARGCRKEDLACAGAHNVGDGATSSRRRLSTSQASQG
jgi:hypothetical protein